MHQDLHLLDIPERVSYKLCLLTHRCLLGKAPVYLSDYYTPVSRVAARQHLRSAARHRLVIPRHRLSTYGRRAFAVAGPTTFNALPDELHDLTVNKHRVVELVCTVTKSIHTTAVMDNCLSWTAATKVVSAKFYVNYAELWQIPPQSQSPVSV